jgi:hypothetical protein
MNINMKCVFAAGIAFAAMAGISAQAAPTAPSAIVENKAESSSPVQRVHGWHLDCRQGPVYYHRHVPGVGRVLCDGGGGGYYGYSWRWRHGHRWRWRHFHGHHRFRGHGGHHGHHGHHHR